MPPTHPESNHQDTKAAKKLAKCFSMFFRQIGKRCPNSSENRGILKPDDPETKELLGVLGVLVVRFWVGGSGRLLGFGRDEVDRPLDGYMDNAIAFADPPIAVENLELVGVELL